MNDLHKLAKKAALQKLLDLMDHHAADDLRGLKDKPAAMRIAVTKLTPLKKDGEDEEDDSVLPGLPDSSEPDADDEEPSDDEKAKISELYNRYCR